MSSAPDRSTPGQWKRRAWHAAAWLAQRAKDSPKKTLRMLTAFWKRWLSATNLFENIAFLSLIAIAAGAIGLAVALCLRHLSKESQMVVGNFTVVETPSNTSGDALGSSAANLLSDSLRDVIEEGATFRGNAYASRSQLFRPQLMSKIPVGRVFDFTWKGVSVSQVKDLWDRARYDEQRITGEVLPYAAAGAKSDAARQWIIHARMDDGGEKTWTSLPFAMNDESMRIAEQDLAEQIMSAKNPELAGRYFLARQQYAKASLVFTQ